MRLLPASAFCPALYPVPLGADEIQLWFFAPDPDAGQTGSRDARVLRLLAAYLGCEPSAVPFDRGEHGKPFVAIAEAIEFNLSHSGGALLVGISREQPLGVDIETLRRARPVDQLARRFFDPGEAAALSQLEASLRQIAFLRLWSCKEAVVKAHGRGIGFGLSRLRFAVDAAGEPQRMNVIHASAGRARDWQIVRLAPASAYVGALAWRGPERPVRAFVASAG